MPSHSLPHHDLDHVLAQTQGEWEELRGRRLFVTGGTGFFGVWLIETFLWANRRLDLGARVCVLSRDPESFCRRMPHLASDPVLGFQAGDVRDFEFPPGEYSHVIHAATDTGARIAAEDPLLLIDTIVEGTRRALDFARHCGARKFLLTSSGAVYGRQPPELTHVPEDFAGAPDPMDPATAYGQAKRLAEHLSAVYAERYGIEAKIARCFALVGPHLPLDAHFAVGNFIRDGLRGGPILVRGDGTARRSYLYAADLAAWLWTILLRGRSGRPYNVGSDVAVSIAELARQVADVVAPGAEVRIASEQEPGKAASRYVPCIARARGELGLAVTVPLAEAIGRTAAWHRRAPVDNPSSPNMNP